MSHPVAAVFLHFLFGSLSKRVLQLYGPSLKVFLFPIAVGDSPRGQQQIIFDHYIETCVCVFVLNDTAGFEKETRNLLRDTRTQDGPGTSYY